MHTGDEIKGVENILENRRHNFTYTYIDFDYGD